MARPRSFDEDKAVEAAMRAFWRGGYEGTSLDALLLETGLSKSSLYETFTDKQTLFLRALERYMEIQQSKLRRLLQEKRPIRVRLRKLLVAIAADSARRGSSGCFMVNSVVGLAATDRRVRELARRNAALTESALAAALEEAARTGDAPSGVKSRAFASFLMGVIAGLRVNGRAGMPAMILRQHVEYALLTLKH